MKEGKLVLKKTEKELLQELVVILRKNLEELTILQGMDSNDEEADYCIVAGDDFFYESPEVLGKIARFLNNTPEYFWFLILPLQAVVYLFGWVYTIRKM